MCTNCLDTLYLVAYSVDGPHGSYFLIVYIMSSLHVVGCCTSVRGFNPVHAKILFVLALLTLAAVDLLLALLILGVVLTP